MGLLSLNLARTKLFNSCPRYRVRASPPRAEEPRRESLRSRRHPPPRMARRSLTRRPRQMRTAATLDPPSYPLRHPSLKGSNLMFKRPPRLPACLKGRRRTITVGQISTETQSLEISLPQMLPWPKTSLKL